MASKQGERGRDSERQVAEKDASGATLDTLIQYRNAAQARSAEAIQAAKNRYEDSKQIGAEKTSQLREAAEQNYDKAKQAASSAAGDFEGWLQEKYNVTKRGASETAQHAQDALPDTNNSRKIHESGESAGEASGQVKQATADSSDAFIAKAKNAQKQAGEIAQQGQEAAEEKSQGILESAKQYAQGIYGAALGRVKSTPDEVQDSAANAKEQVATDQDMKEKSGQSYDIAEGKAGQLYSSAQEQTAQAYSGVREAAGDLVQGIKERLGYAGEQVTQAEAAGTAGGAATAEHKASEPSSETEGKSASVLETTGNVVVGTLQYVKEAVLGSGSGDINESTSSAKTDASAGSGTSGVFQTLSGKRAAKKISKL